MAGSSPVATKHSITRATHPNFGSNGKSPRSSHAFSGYNQTPTILLVENDRPNLTKFLSRTLGEGLAHATSVTEALPFAKGANGQLEGIIISLKPGEKLPEELLASIKPGTPIARIYDSPSPEGKLPFFFLDEGNNVLYRAETPSELYRFILNPSSDISSIRRHLEQGHIADWLMALGHFKLAQSLGRAIKPEEKGAVWDDQTLRLKACAAIYEFLPEEDRIDPYRA